MFVLLEPMVRIELTTSSLPRKRSTTELHWPIFQKKSSGRRGSNPRPSAWKADALPTELLPQRAFAHKKSGQRWIRTTVGVRQQIYSLPHLATLVSAQVFQSAFQNSSSRWRDSNPRPADYKSAALPAELHRLKNNHQHF